MWLNHGCYILGTRSYISTEGSLGWLIGTTTFVKCFNDRQVEEWIDQHCQNATTCSLWCSHTSPLFKMLLPKGHRSGSTLIHWRFTATLECSIHFHPSIDRAQLSKRPWMWVTYSFCTPQTCHLLQGQLLSWLMGHNSMYSPSKDWIIVTAAGRLRACQQWWEDLNMIWTMGYYLNAGKTFLVLP